MSWKQRYEAALAEYKAARDARNQAIYGSDGKEARDLAERKEFEAQEAVAKVMFDAKEEFHFMLRNALRTDPDATKNLLLEGVEDSIVDAVMEGIS